VNLFSGSIKAFQKLLEYGQNETVAHEHLVRDLQETAELRGVCLNRQARQYMESLVETSFPDYSNVPLALSGADPDADAVTVDVEEDDVDDADYDQHDEEPF
jgi:hypothetical protein